MTPSSKLVKLTSETLEDILVGKPLSQRHVLPWVESEGFVPPQIVGARDQIRTT